MSKRAKTLQIIAESRAVLKEENPMTVRQVYYQLVSKQIIDNNRGQYQAVSKALARARLEGIIPWEWIEDRLRRPRHVSMWSGLPEFAETCRRSYRLNVWPSQATYLEVWLEKDALSGIFEAALNPYGVTLNVGRGYDGWDSIHNAAERFGGMTNHNVVVLYFGDFDPSGEDMVRSLEERLGRLDCCPEIIKCALTRNDIKLYKLPPDFAKKSDSRAAAFIAEHGDISVELDALPMSVLRGRLVREVESRMDLGALEEIKELEKEDRAQIMKRLRRK